MAKPTTFRVYVRSCYVGDRMMRTAFTFRQDGLSRVYSIECTLPELNDHIAKLVANYDGVRHSEVFPDERDGEDAVTVSVDPEGRKPNGFNAWKAAQPSSYPWPSN